MALRPRAVELPVALKAAGKRNLAVPAAACLEYTLWEALADLDRQYEQCRQRMVSCSAIISDYGNWDAPAMPTEPLTQQRRHKDNPFVGSLSAMVARPVGRKEVESNP